MPQRSWEEMSMSRTGRKTNNNTRNNSPKSLVLEHRPAISKKRAASIYKAVQKEKKEGFVW